MNDWAFSSEVELRFLEVDDVILLLDPRMKLKLSSNKQKYQVVLIQLNLNLAGRK